MWSKWENEGRRQVRCDCGGSSGRKYVCIYLRKCLEKLNSHHYLPVMQKIHNTIMFLAPQSMKIQ